MARGSRGYPSFVTFPAVATPRRRLFCVPFAGGGPAVYRLWPRTLPDDIEVIAVQLPGRSPSSRIPPVDSIDEIVDIVLTDLISMHEANPLPFSVFGHSLGALITFELAVALEGRSTGPAHVFVSGRRHPEELHRGPQIHTYDDDAFLDELDARYGGVPQVVRNEPELLALFLPALRADIRALETYAPSNGRMLRSPLHVYGGAYDTHPRPDQLSEWQRVAELPISVQLFNGDHFYFTASPGPLTVDIASRWTDDRGGSSPS